jgi:hypothetical protein
MVSGMQRRGNTLRQSFANICGGDQTVSAKKCVIEAFLRRYPSHFARIHAGLIERRLGSPCRTDPRDRPSHLQLMAASVVGHVTYIVRVVY